MAKIEDFFDPNKESFLPTEPIVSQSEPEKSLEPEKSNGSKVLLFIAILIAIVALGLAGYFYWKYNNAEKNIKAREAACQKSIKQAQETIASMRVKEESIAGEQKATEEIVKVRVAVYNGTNITGLAKTLGEKISDIPGVEIASTVNAKKDYTKNIVVDLTGSNLETAQKIAEKLGGEVGKMPDGETKPEADILVIGGKSIK